MGRIWDENGARPKYTEKQGKAWGLGAAGIEVLLRILQGVELRELKLRSIDRFRYFGEKPVY